MEIRADRSGIVRQACVRREPARNVRRGNRDAASGQHDPDRENERGAVLGPVGQQQRTVCQTDTVFEKSTPTATRANRWRKRTF